MDGEGSRNSRPEKKLDKIIDFLHTRPSDKPSTPVHQSKLADNELLRAAVEEMKCKLLHMCTNHEQLVLQYEIDLLKRALLDTQQCPFCIDNLQSGQIYKDQGKRHHHNYKHLQHSMSGNVSVGSDNEKNMDGSHFDDGGHLDGSHVESDESSCSSDLSEDDKMEGDASKSEGKRELVKKFHICEVCCKVFKRRSSLVKHRVTHSDTPVSCKICDQEFVAEVLLEKHMKLHTSNLPFLCNICFQAFPTRDTVKIHRQTHKMESQVCDICNKTLSSPRKLAAHMAIHSDNRPHVCETCGKGFKQKKTLRKHKFIHKDKEKCEFCDKVLAHNSMRSHIEAYHSDETWFSCDSCPRKFRLHQHLLSHRQMHCAGEKCACEECGREFGSKFALSMHMNSHKEVKMVKCNICYKEFSTKAEMERHRATHTDSERKFECETCGKTFHKKQYLIRHQVIHSDVRYPCKVCGKAFTSLWNVREHQKLHEENKPFICPECGKGFISQRYLELHQLSHSDLRPHQCDTCGKSFARLGHLNQHMKIHSDVRAFKCELCDKKFLDGHGLRKHLNAHMRPYYCEFCGERHASQYKLNIHLKTKHPDDVDKLDDGSLDASRQRLRSLQLLSLQDLKKNVEAFMKVNFPNSRKEDLKLDDDDDEDDDDTNEYFLADTEHGDKSETSLTRKVPGPHEPEFDESCSESGKTWENYRRNSLKKMAHAADSDGKRDDDVTHVTPGSKVVVDHYGNHHHGNSAKHVSPTGSHSSHLGCMVAKYSVENDKMEDNSQSNVSATKSFENLERNLYTLNMLQTMDN